MMQLSGLIGFTLAAAAAWSSCRPREERPTNQTPQTAAADVTSRQCIPYEPDTVSLHGRYVRRQPAPDSSSVESIALAPFPALELDRPIDICGRPGSGLNEESLHDVRELQLVTRAPDAAQAPLNSEVRVRGTLFRAHTAHHHTAALLTVISLTRETRR